MKKLTVVSSCLLGSLVVQAAKPSAYVLFPNADKSGDLASLAAWGEGYDQIPTDVCPWIDWHSPNVKASSDITFAGLFLDWYDKSVTVDLSKTTPQPTVTLTDDLYINYHTTANLKGGFYDFGGTHTIACGSYVSGDGNTWISLNLDGCVMTNMACLTMGYAAANGSSYNTWTLANGSAMHTDGQVRFEQWHSGTVSNIIAVLSGSRLVVGDGLMTDRADTPSAGTAFATGNKLLVSGEGSLLSVAKSDTIIGYNFNESWLVVSDHAEAVFTPKGKTGSDVVLGYRSGSNSNRLEVVDWASLTGQNIKVGNGTFENRVYVGDHATLDISNFYVGVAGGSSNRVVVTDGAQLIAKNFYLNCGEGSADNALMISNATVMVTNAFLTCSSDTWSYRGGTGAVIRLQGDAPHLKITHSSSTSPDICNGTRFVFDLPPEGYAEGVVPVAMTDWRTFDKTVRFEANGIGEMLADMKANNIRKRNIKLIETVGNVLSGLCQDNLDASNANLPDGAKFYYEGEGEFQGVPHCRSVWLEVKNPSGLMILLR